MQSPRANNDELTINQALSLGVKHHNEGRLDEAEVLYKKVLDKSPNNADAIHLLGVIARQRGENKITVREIRRAIEINPNSAIYYNNLAMAYDSLGMEEESAKNFKLALKIDARHINAHLAYYNLGVYYMEKGKIEEALEYYEKALEHNKDFAEAHWNRGILLLLLGRLEEGWKEYEYRFKKEKPADSRIFDKPKWDGSSLKGKRILILSEQGFGDNIQFIRYVPLVKEKGGHVILECKKELRRLFENFPGIDEFAEKEKGVIPKIEFDFYIHLMSLPFVFNINFDNISDFPYLKTDNLLVEKFRKEFNDYKFKVGIVWAGNPEQENDKNRSTNFEKFKKLKIPGVKLYSLQKGTGAKQLSDRDIVNIAGKINDFSDTAAVIENLDLIVSVDTSVAHLSGAMGKPTWTLLSFLHDWRYFLNRDDSPWYFNMKLFRQRKLGDWEHVFEDVCNELRKIINTAEIQN